MPEITEADRLLLADLFDLPQEAAMEMFAGRYDGKVSVFAKLNALAAHREQAATAEREATEAAVVAWLRGGEFTVYGRPVTVATLREIANQIEAGAHKC